MQSAGNQFGMFVEKGTEHKWKQKVDITFAKARDKLYAELERLGATNVVISTNHKPDHRGIPIERKRVDDDGVAIYFTLKKRALAMACDRYTSAAANMRSLGLAIDAMRQLDRHGGGTMMDRAFEGFSALPAPGKAHWSTVLGVPIDASIEQIDAAYQRGARECHPDVDGSDAAMAELNTARDRAIKDRSP